MTVTCIVQARMGSSRFPGKVLEPLAGIPLLRLLLDRLQPLPVDHLVVATTTLARDDPVAALTLDAGVGLVRGPEADVLARFGLALEQAPADLVVRLTADCPLVDPAVVADALRLCEHRGADYTSNTLIRTFPDGLDVEVVRADALRSAIAEATDPVEREHVTPFVYRRPERFRLVALRAPELLGDERWTVDTPEDLERLRHDLGDHPDLARAGWRDLLAPLGAPRAPTATGIALRPAVTADRDSVLAWRNDPITVRFSRTQAAVDPSDHAAWFDAVLTDPGHRLWIATIGAIAVGQVRVDVRGGVGTVSIGIATGHRGRGLATPVLFALLDALVADRQVTRLVAEIAADNEASLRAFLRTGFEVTAREDGWITVALPIDGGTNG